MRRKPSHLLVVAVEVCPSCKAPLVSEEGKRGTPGRAGHVLAVLGSVIAAAGVFTSWMQYRAAEAQVDIAKAQMAIAEAALSPHMAIQFDSVGDGRRRVDVLNIENQGGDVRGFQVRVAYTRARVIYQREGRQFDTRDADFPVGEYFAKVTVTGASKGRMASLPARPTAAAALSALESRLRETAPKDVSAAITMEFGIEVTYKTVAGVEQHDYFWVKRGADRTSVSRAASLAGLMDGYREKSPKFPIPSAGSIQDGVARWLRSAQSVTYPSLGSSWEESKN